MPTKMSSRLPSRKGMYVKVFSIYCVQMVSEVLTARICDPDVASPRTRSRA